MREEGVPCCVDCPPIEATFTPSTDITPLLKYRKVAPNHTMTHVLNYALRKTLGGEVDQKGSLVSDEKFRFDFSWGRAVNSDELSSVEAIVNEAVKAELTVHTEVVALKDALAVQGLRAVFGETYPDPVRVVSVGPKVSASKHCRLQYCHRCISARMFYLVSCVSLSKCTCSPES